MKRRPLARPALLLLSAVACIGCPPPGAPVSRTPPPEPTPPPTPQPLPPTPLIGPPSRAIGDAVNDLGFRLFQAVRRGRAGNLALSPAGIWSTLATMQLAARVQATGDAASLDRLLRQDDGSASGAAAYWLAGSAHGGRLVSFVSLFPDRPYVVDGAEPLYSTMRASAVGVGDLEVVDYGGDPAVARRRIDESVAARVEQVFRDVQGIELPADQRPGDLVPRGAIGPSTHLSVVGAVYFRGRWERELTSAGEAPFVVSPGETITVPTLSGRQRVRAARVDGAELVALPYADGSFEMILVVPPEATPLESLEAGLDGSVLDRWVAALAPADVELSLPRFTLRPASLDLGPLLASIGLGLVFDPYRADFSGFPPLPEPGPEGRRELACDALLHATFVQVNERGGVEPDEGGGRGADSAPAIADGPLRAVRVARPFLFVIRETHSGAALVIGRVARPDRPD